MKEQKIDRVIRKTINEHHFIKPSPEFTRSVMEKMGLKTSPVTVKEKPIKARWGLILTFSLYALIAISLLFVPQSSESSVNLIPEFSLPSIAKYLNLSNTVSKMILILTFGGWILILVDNYIK